MHGLESRPEKPNIENVLICKSLNYCCFHQRYGWLADERIRPSYNTLEEATTWLTQAVLAALLAFAPAYAAQENLLRIIDKDTAY